MKIVYVVHVINGKKLVDEVLFFKNGHLDEEDLERIFEAHNLQATRFSMTGWPKGTGKKDYIVDVQCFDVWSCEPKGWKQIMRGVC